MSLHKDWEGAHIFVPMPVSEMWSRLEKIHSCNTDNFALAAFIDKTSLIVVALRDRQYSGSLGTDLLFIWPISIATSWNTLTSCFNQAFHAFYDSIELVAREAPCPRLNGDCYCRHPNEIAYQSLSESQREVIDLRIEGKTNGQIAEYLSIGEGAVEKRIQRIEPSIKQILIDAGIVKR